MRWRGARGAFAAGLSGATLACAAGIAATGSTIDERVAIAAGECRRLPDATALGDLFQSYGPIILLREHRYGCGCQGRSMGGGTEERHRGAAEEERNAGGTVEERASGGTVEERAAGGLEEARSAGGKDEARAHGAGDEARNSGGGNEARAHGAGEEERQHGGEEETLRCTPGADARCTGFLLHHTANVSYFDGAATVALAGDCVVEHASP